MEVSSDPFGSTALREQPDVSRNGIDLHTGISFQAKRPFRDEPYVFFLSAQWEARAFFKNSLSAQESIGKSFLLACQCSTDPLRNRRQTCFHSAIAHPWPRPRIPRVTRSLRLLPRPQGKNLCPWVHCIERPLRNASRNTNSLSELGTRAIQFWHAIQELSLVLTPSGRRNSAVLRDWLHSIRAFLSGTSQDSLVVPMDTYQSGTVTVGLVPLRAQSDPP